eukprot:TRINITY_DN5778_c0_g1_i5.p1 TRINITY_DN5778_c0_g1~~TRINITY_DN5778_c0_g1_i5.p1  ORF type:complete len:200 (-),score=32.04 TRINITY_DN5778_c0_g1_i5:430-1029(-)
MSKSLLNCFCLFFCIFLLPVFGVVVRVSAGQQCELPCTLQNVTYSLNGSWLRAYTDASVSYDISFTVSNQDQIYNIILTNKFLLHETYTVWRKKESEFPSGFSYHYFVQDSQNRTGMDCFHGTQTGCLEPTSRFVVSGPSFFTFSKVVDRDPFLTVPLLPLNEDDSYFSFRLDRLSNAPFGASLAFFLHFDSFPINLQT